MSFVNKYLCNLTKFDKKLKGEDLSPEKKQELFKRLDSLTKAFDAGKDYNNIKDFGYNDNYNWDRLWLKYTGLEWDPITFPPTFKDIRKFEQGLKAFDKTLGNYKNPWFEMFVLPKAAMRAVPELHAARKLLL